MFYLAQIFGVIGVFFLILSYQQTKRTKFLILQLFINFAYIFQYIILRAFSGLFICFVNSFKNIIFYKYEKKGKTAPFIYLLILEIIVTLYGFLCYTNIYGLIPIIITLIYNIAVWQRNLKITYFVGILAGILWFVYAMYVSAYAAAIGSVFEVLASTVGLIKLYRIKNSD